MILTGALEYENLSVIGMMNRMLVLCQDSGQSRRNPALSCRAAGSAALTSPCMSQDSSRFPICRRPDRSAARVYGSQVLSCVLPRWCNTATDAEVAVEHMNMQLSTEYHVSPVNIPRCNVMHAVHMHEQRKFNGLLLNDCSLHRSNHRQAAWPSLLCQRIRRVVNLLVHPSLVCSNCKDEALSRGFEHSF